jgi:exopolysaccharide biosynthesis polyprenyl glycosylphosphotransferase
MDSYVLLQSQRRRLASGVGRAARQRWLIAVLVLWDITAIGLAFVLATYLRFATHFPIFYEMPVSTVDAYLRLGLWLIPAWLAIFAIVRLYDPHLLWGGTTEYQHIVYACSLGMMALILGSFFFPEFVIARAWLLMAWILTTAFVGVGRFAMRRMVYRLRSNGHMVTPTLIIGANEEAQAIAEQILATPQAGLRLVGLVDDDRHEGEEVMPGVRVVASIASARELVDRNGVGELIVATTALTRERLLDLFVAFGTTPDVTIRMSSGMYETMATGMRVKEIGAVPLLSLNKLRLTGLDVVFKTALDYTLSGLVLLLLLPVLGAVALWVKLDSPGPVIYRRRVVGTGGRLFDAFKFRTMATNGAEILRQYPELEQELRETGKLKNDPRITRAGRFLRRFSLDELPQLFNVLQGEMSLVGPRMITAEEIGHYGRRYLSLLAVKPGITGLWQVSGRSDVTYRERVKLDLHYIRNYSIWLDLWVLYQTVPAVFKGKGAY